ncbi:hypothetical protein AWZ03_010599 [Drosophila navojoa]|uniref:Uncharacterized protein n=1 Tax=Drosophila navojoa TaxID=7232 RepID=A0A484B3U5_DRONA|nr:hypothetical protein AWZ03_010599 [Drosophila navojoa]
MLGCWQFAETMEEIERTSLGVREHFPAEWQSSEAEPLIRPIARAKARVETEPKPKLELEPWTIDDADADADAHAYAYAYALVYAAVDVRRSILDLGGHLSIHEFGIDLVGSHGSRQGSSQPFNVNCECENGKRMANGDCRLPGGGEPEGLQSAG